MSVLNIRTIWLAFMLAQAKDMKDKCQTDSGDCVYRNYETLVGQNQRPSACMVGVLVGSGSEIVGYMGAVNSLAQRDEFHQAFKPNGSDNARHHEDFLQVCQNAHDCIGWSEVAEKGFETAFLDSMKEVFSDGDSFGASYLDTIWPTKELIEEAHTMLNTPNHEEGYGYGSWRDMAQKYQVEGYSTPVESQTSESGEA